MKLITGMPRGTKDLLPDEAYEWAKAEERLMKVASRYGFREIRFPTFEHTELFARGVGGTTDVVQKEMYTFQDKGGRSVTLRPEGTASCMRAVLENGLYGGALPLKLCYFANCFRYEKPQAGRLREFHQFGAELFGSADPEADAEIIMLASAVLSEFSLSGLRLEINSIGCKECRAEYKKALRDYFCARESELCETCKGRLETNPMRILDCKSPVCREIAKGAPKIIDYLCGSCAEHFEKVKSRLSKAGIEYVVNPTIVRGLDYYSRTVFEFIDEGIGAQSTVLGGGRYDGLACELGEVELPALGFAMGLERLMLSLENRKAEKERAEGPDVFIAGFPESADKAAELCEKLRALGLYAERDISGRSLKAQMKYADKLGAKNCVVIGGDELAKGRAALKNMSTGETGEVGLEAQAIKNYICMEK